MTDNPDRIERSIGDLSDVKTWSTSGRIGSNSSRDRRDDLVLEANDIKVEAVVLIPLSPISDRNIARPLPNTVRNRNAAPVE